MAASSLLYMKTNPKIIFFTDFDGTITLQDSNDFLVIAFDPRIHTSKLTLASTRPITSDMAAKSVARGTSTSWKAKSPFGIRHSSISLRSICLC